MPYGGGWRGGAGVAAVSPWRRSRGRPARPPRPTARGRCRGGVAGGEEDEAGGAVFQDGAGEFVRPLPHRAADPAAAVVAGPGQGRLGDLPRQVEDGGDGGRIATGLLGGPVDQRPGGAVPLAHPVRGVAGYPPVGEPAGHVERPLAERAGPDQRRRHVGRFDPAHLVELAEEGDRFAPAGQGAHQRDRLLQRAHRLAGAEPGPAEPLDVVPQPAGADPEHDPAAGQGRQGGERAGEHRRGPAGQVGHVRQPGDARGGTEDEAQRGVRVQPVPVVRMVRGGEQVEAGPVGLHAEPDDLGRPGGLGPWGESEQRGVLRHRCVLLVRGRVVRCCGGARVSRPPTGRARRCTCWRRVR